MPNWCPTFSTTMGVIDGIHRYTADPRPTPQPAAASCLTNGEVLMVYVPHLSEGSPASSQDHPNFAGRQTQGCVAPFPSHQLSRGAGRTGQLTALTGLQLNVVDNTTNGNILQRQCITYPNVGLRARLNDIAHLQP